MGHGHRTEHYINSVVPRLPLTERLSSQFWACYGLESLFVGKIIQSTFRVPQLTYTPYKETTHCRIMCLPHAHGSGYDRTGNKMAIFR